LWVARYYILLGAQFGNSFRISIPRNPQSHIPLGAADETRERREQCWTAGGWNQPDAWMFWAGLASALCLMLQWDPCLVDILYLDLVLSPHSLALPSRPQREKFSTNRLMIVTPPVLPRWLLSATLASLPCRGPSRSGPAIGTCCISICTALPESPHPVQENTQMGTKSAKLARRKKPTCPPRREDYPPDRTMLVSSRLRLS
jgi:hypothetical protein